MKKMGSAISCCVVVLIMSEAPGVINHKSFGR